jgi:hypothetical protein
MPRDERPEIPPSRRRATAVDFAPAEAVAAERQRLKAEQQRRKEARAPLGRQRTSHDVRLPPEPEEERGDVSEADKRRVKEAVRGLRGD